MLFGSRLSCCTCGLSLAGVSPSSQGGSEHPHLASQREYRRSGKCSLFARFEAPAGTVRTARREDRASSVKTTKDM